MRLPCVRVRIQLHLVLLVCGGTEIEYRVLGCRASEGLRTQAMRIRQTLLNTDVDKQSRQAAISGLHETQLEIGEATIMLRGVDGQL